MAKARRGLLVATMRDIAIDLGLVALGGAAGSMLRFGISTWLPTKEFPWATLAVNLLGSFVIGALMLPSGLDHGPRLLLVVGLLGGFTTLSSFSFETIDLWRSQHVGLALANLLANGLGGPLAAVAGWRIAQMVGAASPA